MVYSSLHMMVLLTATIISFTSQRALTSIAAAAIVIMFMLLSEESPLIQ